MVSNAGSMPKRPFKGEIDLPCKLFPDTDSFLEGKCGIFLKW